MAEYIFDGEPNSNTNMARVLMGRACLFVKNAQTLDRLERAQKTPPDSRALPRVGDTIYIKRKLDKKWVVYSL